MSITSAVFTLTQNQQAVLQRVKEMTLVKPTLKGNSLEVTLLPPFHDEEDHGARMDRVERTVMGLDPKAARKDND